jgi:antitoxin CptB
MVGGFFDLHHAHWSEGEISWFERLIDEEDVDIMGWAIGSIPVPADYQGDMMAALQRLDYISV